MRLYYSYEYNFLITDNKFSGANADREVFIFPVQLTTSRIGNLTRLIHALAVCVTIQRFNSCQKGIFGVGGGGWGCYPFLLPKCSREKKNRTEGIEITPFSIYCIELYVILLPGRNITLLFLILLILLVYTFKWYNAACCLSVSFLLCHVFIFNLFFSRW